MRISDWSSDVCSSDLCVVVAPASGSRGVYGAISIAGAWGLPKGCAVAYTDKGAGTDYFDLDAQGAARADGTFGTLAARDELAFAPDAPVAASRSEEHTSELQSLMRISYAVFCLKKKKRYKYQNCKTTMKI